MANAIKIHRGHPGNEKTKQSFDYKCVPKQELGNED
jgi:hypothetical protein